MKKKGLIIATIVMVLVLAVSLTTATYAWFTLSPTTTVEAIDFSVGTASDLVIGLKADNIYNAQAKGGDFVYGTTVLGDSFKGTDGFANGAIPAAGNAYWTGEPGLFNAIDMQLDMSNLQKAVGTGKVYDETNNIDGTAKALDLATLRTAASTSAEGTIMASGIDAAVSATTVERAFAQRDYLDVVIGVQASAADLEQIICNITINPNADDYDLGMNAAIHVAYAVNGMATSTVGSDIYGNNHYSTSLESLGTSLALDYNGDEVTTTEALGGPTGAKVQTLNNGAVNIPVEVADAGAGAFLSRQTIYQIHIVIWIDGTDSDCLNSALGVGSSIYINFQAVAPGREG